MNGLIRIIETSGGNKYVYHPIKNKLYKLKDENALNDVSFFVNSPIDVSFEELEFLKNKIYPNKVTFCLTHECNFKCSYCVYGGRYESLGYRKHSKTRMSKDIINNSIISMMDGNFISNELNVVCFYGGEPLIEFSMIKYTTEMINSLICPTHKIQYSITTNASLLLADKLDFLVNNNFKLTISIDGNKDLHDKNRVFKNGKGTYNVIFKNLLYIKKKFPEFYKDINFNITHDSEDLSMIIDFLSDNCEMFPIKQVQFSEILANNESNVKMINKGITNILSDALNSLINQYNPPQKKNAKDQYIHDIGIDLLFEFLLNNVRRLSFNGVVNGKINSGGCCDIGKTHLFIDSDGNYYYCEKMANTHKIGDCYSGLNNKLIYDEIVAYRQDILEKCKKCWAISLCSLCYFTYDYRLSVKEKKNICELHKRKIELFLMLYCKILDEDLFFFQRHYNKYNWRIL